MRFLMMLAVACLAIAGCRQTPAESSMEEGAFEIACESPRPQMCTREYRPVCGLRDTGIRCVTTPCDSTEWRSYGNACTACSDPEVFGYKQGECRPDDVTR